MDKTQLKLHIYILFFRFLATGDSFKTIAFSYRVGHSTVFNVVNETCKVLVASLERESLKRESLERENSQAGMTYSTSTCQRPHTPVTAHVLERENQSCETVTKSTWFFKSIMNG